MLRNRLYYSVKPFIPYALRMGLRSWMTRRKLRRVAGTWPILPGSERPPEGWPGWPEGKKFAFVLTHDVEGQIGFDKIPRLMDLEEQLGFRSSFNLIPRGEYQVTPDVVQSITSRGFEVGVHDLYHDGRLFLNKPEFDRNKSVINQCLKDWGAVGFRSGFMLRNLEWLHQLDIQYDLSTFDTDPFEPQPDGVGTVFPFWIPAPAWGPSVSGPGVEGPVVGSCRARLAPSAGYVELPYTLPQDSTLFLLLREQGSDIWLRKLEWIAEHGGMALVNVHPDYLRFESEPASNSTFSVKHYIHFLEYARQRFADAAWETKPGELAEYVWATRPLRHRRQLRIGMVTHSHFLSDARVSRYAHALAERGDFVEVLALQRDPREPRTERLGNISLVRVQQRSAKTETSPVGHLLPILRFLRSSFLHLTREHARCPYDLLHIHNLPDFLVLAGLYPRLCGAPIILDIHDVLPEFYASKFAVSPKSGRVRLLKLIERVSAWAASHIIIANDLWLEKFELRTRANGKCSVFINNVDSRVFFPRSRTRDDGKLIILFPGGLQWHQGLDIAIRAFTRVTAELPHAEFHIYGDGNRKPDLMNLTRQLGLQDKVLFFEPCPVSRIAEVMAEADLGVVPKRADSFGNEAYSTKIMEFMASGVPVVASDTRIDRFYFDDSVVRFFRSGDPEALAVGIIEVLSDPLLRERLTRNGLDYAARSSWETRKREYLALVDSLVATGQPPVIGPGQPDRPPCRAEASDRTRPTNAKGPEAGMS